MKDRGAFVDFQQIPNGDKWIYVENNTRIQVKGIGICKLVLRGGWTLILYEVLYALSIRKNLVYVLVLLKFGFNWYFCDDNIRLCLSTIFYGSSFVLNGFIVMDIDHFNFNNNVSFSLVTISHNHKNDVHLWHARLNHIDQDRMSRLAK